MTNSSPTSNVVTNTVLVGVDGSEASLHSVDWAAREAMHRHASLTLLYVTQWPEYGTSWLPAEDGPEQRAMDDARDALLAQAEDRARQHGKDFVIVRDKRDGYPSEVILERGKNAQLVVLGRRGSGGFFNLALGSTAYQVAHRCQRPIVLVPAEEPSYSDSDLAATGVLVGVDGTADSQEAVGFAFAEASVRNMPLTAIRAWSHPVFDAPVIRTPFPPLPEDYVAEQEEILGENVAGWAEKYPDVVVRRRVVHGRPARALLKAAWGADLLVVGSQGRSGMGVPRLGSVSDALVRHAQCPVAVVRS